MSHKKHLGHQARKRFGQNFLNNDYIIESIVDAIAASDAYTMVEIGPGLGAITEPVAAQVNRLHVVELDKDLVARLEAHPTLQHKLDIHQGDALRYDFGQLIEPNKSMKVFGNLPYNISTPLMFHIKYVEHSTACFLCCKKKSYYGCVPHHAAKIMAAFRS